MKGIIAQYGTTDLEKQSLIEKVMGLANNLRGVAALTDFASRAKIAS
jgi:hypothetical protein